MENQNMSIQIFQPGSKYYLPNEDWKRIEDYPNYFVSNLGRVYNELTKTLLKTPLGVKNRYPTVNLCKDGVAKLHTVHRLVAKAFVPNPNAYPMVRHLDGSRDNNVSTNLMWGTALENYNDSVNDGTNVPLSDESILKAQNLIRKRIFSFNLSTGEVTHYSSCTEASKKLGIDKSNITTCLKGQTHRAGNYYFGYESLGGNMEHINCFPGYEYVNGKNMYRGIDIGRGGYVYSNPGMYEDVAMLDVNSMHPSSIIALNLYGKYTKRFSEIVEARLAIKHRDLDKARVLLNGELSPYLENPTEEELEGLTQALKLLINMIYGVGSASFPNKFRDPRNVNNIVALRGALFMKTLQDEVTERGYTVVGIRTDSIKIANADQKIIAFCMEFAKKYSYVFEHETTYDRLCLVDKTNYIAKYDQYGIRNKGGKHAGEWTATGAQFQHPYIFKTLFSKEELTFKDLCETKEVSNGGAIYLDFNEGLSENDHDYHFVGRVGLFTPVQAGRGGAELMVKRDDKYSAVSGTKGYRWLESEQIRLMSLEDSIDMSYFHRLADNAIDSINKYGDFEHFVGEGEYVPEGGV